MAEPSRWTILHLEDNALDREVVGHALAAAGIAAEIVCVATRDEFTAALAEGKYDLILADYTLPGFDGAEALGLARRQCPGVPFVFVSGTIGEEHAIECLKKGATDYVLKERPARLGPAVRRALGEGAEHARAREAEAALRQSEERHRLLFERNPQPMWMYDVTTLRFLAVNDAAVAHYGWSREEFLAMTILDIRPPEDAPAVRESVKLAPTRFRAGETWRHRRKDGSILIVEIAAHHVPFGERDARLVMINDVTERQRAAEALERERTLLRTLIDRLPDLIYAKDAASRFVLANETVARFMGADSPAALLGRTDAEFHPPALAAEFRADEERVLAGAPLINKEEPGTRADGSKRVLLTTKLPLRDPAGEVTALIGIGHDITDRKAAEDARRASEERFAAIFDSSPVAIGYGTPDGRMLDVNRQACELFGYGREELIGRTVQELHLWAKPEERRAAMERLHAEKAVRNFEAKFRRKSGEVRTGLLSMDLLPFATEPALLVTIVDITERKKLEEELQRSQRVQSVGRLASGIAHDMNNILAPIMMSAPLLRMNLPPAETEQTLATIEASARRGAELVKQLLMYGRGVEGERGPVRLADLIGETAKIARETFPRNIVVRTQLAPDAWPVRGDASQLHQVLLNLCVNARDAMPNGGTLTIGAQNARLDETFAAMHAEVKPGAFVRLSVADTGTGIPPQIVDKIFDPFFTTKAVGQGTGLGLSTVLGVVKSHGGFVSVQSEVDAGTTFEVFLPVVSEAEEAKPASTAAAAPLRGAGELILVVDDEESIRTVLRQMLLEHNYRVLVASDGAEASAVFARNLAEIALVATDIDMPYLDGVSLVRALQRMKPGIKVLVSSGLVSARNTRARVAELKALGVPQVLEKPYTAEKILTAVHAALHAGEVGNPPPSASGRQDGDFAAQRKA